MVTNSSALQSAKHHVLHFETKNKDLRVIIPLRPYETNMKRNIMKMKIKIKFILSAKAKRKEIIKLESSKTSTKLDFAKEDQTSASSFWQSHLASPSTSAPFDAPFFSATHGIVQTHPSLSVGIPGPMPLTSNSLGSGSSSSNKAALTAGSGYLNSRGSLPSSARYPSLLASNTVVSPNPKSPFRHLDFSTSATAELRRNPALSAPDECARACREGEPPRICYYHFTLEYYTVLGAFVNQLTD
uniref:Uncharacterized protein n=1 Tax=Glossina austeni TaxID=7395 RepID=A0A1A9VT64_GLOAU